MYALISGSVAVDRRQRCMHPTLVDKEQPLGLNRRSHHHPPGSSLELITLRCGSSPFFLLDPIRAMARQMVERLTESPVRACVVATLLEGGERPLPQVRLQELGCFLVQLRSRSGALLRG